FLQFLLDAVHLTTPLADNYPGLGSMDSNNQFIECALDYDLSNSAFVDTGIQIGPDFVVLNQLVRVIFLATIPVGFPSADDSQSGSNRICFLTHILYLKFR